MALLQRRGYTVVARNVRCGRVELDIVARDAESLVFVEVKARWSERFGAPEEAITPAKRRNIIRAAQHYILANDLHHEPWRVDVLALRLRGVTLLHWELYRNALGEE